MTAEKTPAAGSQLTCPREQTALEPVSIASVQVYRCPNCGSTWYPRDRLRMLKDHEDNGDYRWIDVDLWKEAHRFRVESEQRYRCPQDGDSMTTVRYGEANVAVDFCLKCGGIWLDRGEYDAILVWLGTKVDASSVDDYLEDLREELVEVLTGREGPIEELKDLSKVLYLLELRWFVEHPRVQALVDRLRLP